MKEKILRWLNVFGLQNPNVVFLAFVAAFFLDSAINYYFDFPLFVLFIMLTLPVLWLSLWLSDYKPVFLLLFVSMFGISVFINTLIYPFNNKNISDLVFILLFATSFYYYHFFRKKLTLKAINIFLIAATIMIIPEFFKGKSIQNLQQEPQTNNTVSHETTVPPAVITFDQSNMLNSLEEPPKRISGIYRVPHIAAYFFGFLSLFYAFFYFRNKKWIYLAVSLLAATFVILSGIRSIVFAMAMSFLLYLFIQRKMLVFLVSGGLVTLVLLFRFQLYFLLNKTFLKPYLALVVTLVDNSSRQTRVMLWKSWFLEMKEFIWYHYLSGKTFFASLLANKYNLHHKVWFHNDFLSVVYSYGLFCLVMYVGLWVIIYRSYAKIIKRNVFIFVFYFAGVFAAFFNGYYYYFPVLLLFMFFLMINEEKKNLPTS